MESSNLVLSLVGAVGLGGVVGAYFQSRFQHEKEVQEDIHQLKRKRYGAILIFMLTQLNPERGLAKTQQHRPDITSLDDIKDELRTEMLHSVLFASDEVVRSMAIFIRQPTYPAYITTVSAMRKDLWGKETTIGEDVLKGFIEIQ